LVAAMAGVASAETATIAAITVLERITGNAATRKLMTPSFSPHRSLLRHAGTVPWQLIARSGVP
jgi:hypothetical protein